MSLIRPLTRGLVQPLTRGIAATRGGGKRDIDLFIIVGQSNAEGRGDSSLSPAAPNGRYISGSTITSPLADPVGGAVTGSMWPAFSNEWFAQTGRLSAFVECATGGSSLIEAADTGSGNWSANGALRAAAVSAADDAIAALEAAPGYNLGNVYFLWAQGEREAQSVNGSTITGALYEQALEDLAAYFKTEVAQMAVMGVVRLGNMEPRASEQGWADIRAAQEAATTDSANLRMLYRGAASFPASGMALMATGPHYTQGGYDLAGRCAARELSSATETPALAAPALLAHQEWTDTDWTASASQTRSHTTNAGAKALVVAIPTVRGAASGGAIGTCTFNGVAMTKIAEVGLTNATPQLRAMVAIFYLNESDYGSPLGGVTADIVHTPVESQNILQLAAFDLGAEVQPDNSVTASGNAASSLTGTITTDAATFVVAVSCAGVSGGTVPTTTITGGTEVLDAGGIRPGSDRSGSGCVAYATAAESVGLDFGAAYSASAACAVHMVAAFRAKIDGE